MIEANKFPVSSKRTIQSNTKVRVTEREAEGKQGLLPEGIKMMQYLRKSQAPKKQALNQMYRKNN